MQLPALTFTPNGFDTFISLMGLMIDVKVDVTYFQIIPASWGRGTDDRRELSTLTNQYIIFVDDVALGLSDTKQPNIDHLPRQYRHKRHLKPQLRSALIPWTDIRFLEIVA